jgi:hypothetical protein
MEKKMVLVLVNQMELSMKGFGKMILGMDMEK